MILSISFAMKAAGRVNYYMGHAQEAYYLEGIRQEGHWFGTAVAKLGLKPVVDRKTFHNLLLGFSPDGKKALVQNAGDPNRASCWDLTFSAPKSVSVLWALAPPKTRKQIEKFMQRAVEKTLTYIEEVAGITRRGKGGVIKERASLTFATFFEGVSRANDPAIHIHVCLVNLGLRGDGTTGALQTKEVFQHKMFGGALAGRVLAEQLRQELGLIIEPDKVGFHIAGIPKNLCSLFSKRARTIKKVMSEQGLEGAVAAKIIALATRPNKHQLPPERLFAQWQEVAQQFGWGSEKVQLLLEQGQQRLANGQIPERHPESAHSWPGQEPPTTARVPGEQAQQPAGKSGEKEARKSPERKPSEPQREQGTNDGVGPSRGRPDQRDKKDQRRRKADQLMPVLRPRQRSKARNNSSQQRQTRSPGGDDPGTGSTRSGSKGERDQGARKGRSGSSQERQTRSPGGDDPGAGSSQSDSKGDHGQGTRKAKGWFTRHDFDRWWRSFHAAEDGSTQGSNPMMSPGEQGFRFRVEMQRLFPKAPFWSLAQFVKVPVIVFPEPQPQWADASWEKTSFVGELRGQQRRLFPDAPKWSPLHGFTIPALHLSKPSWMTELPETKWWSMSYKKVIGPLEFRIQTRHPFRFAPRWNPLRNLEIPALRLTTKKSKWKPMQHPQREDWEQHNRAQKQAQEMGRSH